MHTHTHTHTHMCLCIYIALTDARRPQIEFSNVIVMNKCDLLADAAGLFTRISRSLYTH